MKNINMYHLYRQIFLSGQAESRPDDLQQITSRLRSRPQQ